MFFCILIITFSLNPKDIASSSITNTSTSSIIKLNNITNTRPTAGFLQPNDNLLITRNGNVSVGSGNIEEDQEDLTSTIPPPMNVIKPEHAEQVIFSFLNIYHNCVS